MTKHKDISQRCDKLPPEDPRHGPTKKQRKRKKVCVKETPEFPRAFIGKVGHFGWDPVTEKPTGTFDTRQEQRDHKAGLKRYLYGSVYDVATKSSGPLVIHRRLRK